MRPTQKPARRVRGRDEDQSENESLDEDNQLTRVKIGKIPYGWYEDFKHFGYDNKLNKVIKDKKEDKIEEFIRKSENKDWWRTIRDELNSRDIRLTDAQLALIDRIRSGKMASKKIATEEYVVSYPYDDPFPIHAHPPAKRNFMPSKWEQMKVNKILDGLLTGRIPWNPPVAEAEEPLFDAWASGEIVDRGVINIAPMKMKLPGHAESYNPPKEFLLTPEQLKEWQEMDEEDRPFNFIPNAFGKMRHIPFYDRLINERFQRCLDLYLCPRVKKKKLNIDPDILIPKLPDPSSMKPFPTATNISYIGHNAAVSSICASPSGDYLATGDQSGLFIIWGTLSSRALLTRQFSQPIFSISWSCANLLAFSHGPIVEILAWKYSKELRAKGEAVIEEAKINHKGNWHFYQEKNEEYQAGLRVRMNFESNVEHLQFQKSKGDYLVTVCPDSIQKNEVVAIHRLSKGGSQTGFIKGSSIFKSVSFYPKKPQLVILTNTRVQIFDLEQMTSAKKLSGGINTYSCMSVHPQGGYILTGTDNAKLVCFDLDFGGKPFKSMEYHDKAITAVDFHQSYPLMASSSHDASIHVFHFKNNANSLEEAVIVPLKVLRGHASRHSEGVKRICFHPHQPWLFSVGKDHKVLLWT